MRLFHVNAMSTFGESHPPPKSRNHW